MAPNSDIEAKDASQSMILISHVVELLQVLWQRIQGIPDFGIYIFKKFSHARAGDWRLHWLSCDTWSEPGRNLASCLSLA